MKIHLFFVVFLVLLGNARGQGGIEVSDQILRGLSTTNLNNLARAAKFFAEKPQLFEADILKKGNALKAALEARNVPSASSTFGDRSALCSGLASCAANLSAGSTRDHKQLAAHLFDLVISLEPDRVDAAYEREKLIVKDKVTLDWSVVGKKKVTVSSAPSRGIFAFNFNSVNQSGSSSKSVAGLAKSQALIKGLLVQELSGSQFAGSASQMNATVLKTTGSGPMEVGFNQAVGSTMSGAVDNMMKFLVNRYTRLPRGVRVELSFEEQYIPKDGPSAGVACTLMLDSLLKGHDFASDFAVTGALDAKGKVGGVGGVDGKIRGAIARRCEVIAIPSENESVISDLLIIEGPATLAKIQIVEIETYDDALKIAKVHDQRSPEIKKAIETFREVQRVLNQRGGITYLQNPKVQEKLRSVVRVIPNHLSAKYLLLKAVGRNPSHLTLIGSVQAIDRKAAPLLHHLQEGNFDVEDRLARDNFAHTISALGRLRPLLDARTRPCADAIIRYSGFVRTAFNNPPRARRAQVELLANIKKSGSDVGNQYEKLFDREDVKKELMMD